MTPFWDNTERQWQRKFFTVGRTSDMVKYFVWKKKWPAVLLFTNSQFVTNELAAWSGTWKVQDWKIDEKDIWEGVCG